jgi:TatD DNase family protein
MKLIDTHCHLMEREFDLDRASVIKRAEKNSIAMITSAITPSEYESTVRLANTHPSIHATLGLDPLLYSESNEAIDLIQKYKRDIIAIGEVGLDFYLERNQTQRMLQQKIFKEMIKLSTKLQLPIQIHSRSAGRKALEVLESCDANKVHMHAFDGKASLARMASTDRGYYFSIPTSVVRSPQKQKLVKAVDIEHILLETDSPVLGPEKQSRNVPSNLPIALKEVATILNRSEEEIRDITLENTLRLYKKINPNRYPS